MKSWNFDRSLVDVYEVAFVGGNGTSHEVAAHFIQAVELYNDSHGTNLIIKMENNDD